MTRNIREVETSIKCYAREIRRKWSKGPLGCRDLELDELEQKLRRALQLGCE